MKNQKHYLEAGQRVPNTLLRVVRELEPCERKRTRIVECVCDCGNITFPRIPDLMNGKVKSCGCFHKRCMRNLTKTHGDSRTRLYSIWTSMLTRCYTISSTSYKNYGAKGIRVCDDWRKSYPNFKNWAMNNGYTDNLTIERECNKTDYCPQNSKWIPVKLEELRSNNDTIQSWNISTVNIVTIDCIEYPSINEAVRKTGLSHYLIKKYCDDSSITNYTRKLKN